MVIVVGTSHTNQISNLSFSPFLERLCQEFKVCGIAEEMSQEGLTEKGFKSTIPRLVARALEMPHRFCDPNLKERVRLGVQQEREIRLQDKYSRVKLTEPEILSRGVEGYKRRERYWLEKLNDFNVWPVLFVCGADHVTSFRQILEQQGIAVHIAAEDWAG